MKDEDNRMNEQTSYTPEEYFEIIKSKKQTVTDTDLQKIYDNCLELLNKYKITGQKKGMQKLVFHIECIEKERELIKLGVDTFIYRDDVEEYIDNIAKDVVKIIELENYEREIPDEIVKVIEATSGIFDKLYVVFTDYTGKVERQVEKERRATDPILFGTFQNESTRAVNDRFYYLGDWEDEYCDLTLDRMVSEVKDQTERNIAHTIRTPTDIEQLKEDLKGLNITSVGNIVVAQAPVKQSWFAKVKSIFTK